MKMLEKAEILQASGALKMVQDSHITPGTGTQTLVHGYLDGVHSMTGSTGWNAPWCHPSRNDRHLGVMC